MANSQERTFGQKLNTWVQTTAIIFAALWGFYTFWITEIMLPNSAPVNITLNVELKKIGTGESKSEDPNEQFVPVEIRVSAKNPSAREIHLLPSAWIVYGYKIIALAKTEPFEGTIASFNDGTGYYMARHTAADQYAVVAAGELFPDDSLKPNEVTTRTMIIYVPPSEYDVLEVQATMIAVERRGEVEIEWKWNDLGLELMMYRIGQSGERIEIETDEEDAYSDPNLELQQARTTSELSLWQET